MSKVYLADRDKLYSASKARREVKLPSLTHPLQYNVAAYLQIVFRMFFT
jgi:hypothetical protein